MNCIVFLNENPLPPVFTKGQVAGKELRLRAALSQIDEVHVISRQGNTVSFNNRKRTKLETKIIVHLLPPWPYYLAGIPLFLVGLYYCLKLKPKTIEAESPIISGPAAVLLGKLFHIPSVVEVRASYEELIKQKLRFIPVMLKKKLLDLVFSRTVRHADLVIANSKLYQAALNKIGVSSEVINPGLQYPPKTVRKKVGKRLFTVGFLGRLVPEKGVGYLLEALRVLSSDPQMKPFQAEIAGDGPDRTRLESICTKKNLNSVRFLGFAPGFKVLPNWHVLVNPNLVKHPLEMVNAEAAFSGVPVICFGTKAYPETVEDGITGIKVSRPDPVLLAKAIKTVALQPALHKKLSGHAPQFARKHYDFENQVVRLQKAYAKTGVIF